MTRWAGLIVSTACCLASAAQPASVKDTLRGAAEAIGRQDIPVAERLLFSAISDTKATVHYTGTPHYGEEFTKVTSLAMAQTELEKARVAYGSKDWDSFFRFAFATTAGLANLNHHAPAEDVFQIASSKVQGGGSASWLDLHQAAKAALAAGHTEAGLEYIRREIAAINATVAAPAVGINLHRALTVEGLLHLAAGDVSQANALLLGSIPAGAYPIMKISGPSMALASRLLAAGQADTVWQYLELCKTLEWSGASTKIPVWEAAIRQHQTPDFGRYAVVR